MEVASRFLDPSLGKDTKRSSDYVIVAVAQIQ